MRKVLFDEVPRALDTLLTELRLNFKRIEAAVQRPVISERSANELHVVAQLIKYAFTQLEAFRDAWSTNLDLGILALRRLHEASLIGHWFATDRDAIWLFLFQRISDERQLLEAFGRLSTREDAPARTVLRERLDELDELETRWKDRLGVVLGADEATHLVRRLARRRPTWKQLAEGADKAHGDRRAQDDYGALYALTSKQLHLSPISVLTPLPVEHERWGVLFLAVQGFVHDLVRSTPQIPDE